jgi:hypothetical protein
MTQSFSTIIYELSVRIYNYILPRRDQPNRSANHGSNEARHRIGTFGPDKACHKSQDRLTAVTSPNPATVVIIRKYLISGIGRGNLASLSPPCISNEGEINSTEASKRTRTGHEERQLQKLTRRVPT